MTILVARNKGTNSDFSILHDLVLQTGAIAIDDNDYGSNDRTYDVKGLINMHVEIDNTGTTENGLTYKIEKARKDFVVLTDLVDADFDQDIKADTNVAAALKASGTVTCASAVATDTVTANGLLYTGVAGVKSDNTEFSIDTSDTACATDLADSITNDTRTGTLNDLTATSSVAVVTIKQTVSGTSGNATTLVSSNGTRLAVSGAVFTGGTDAVTSISDVVDVSPESTAIRIRVKRQTSGQDTILAGIVSVN